MEPERLNSLLQYSLSDLAGERKPLSLLDELEEPQGLKRMLFEESILEQIRNAVVVSDIEGKIIYCNRYATTLYHWQAAEVLGQNIFEVIKLENSPKNLEKIIDIVTQKGEWQGQLKVKRKDGSYCRVDCTYSALKDRNGKITGWVGVAFESCHGQQVKESLHQNETNQILWESLPDAMFCIRFDGTFLDIKAAKEFSNQLPKRKILGKKLTEILPKELASQAMQNIERSLETGKMRIFEYQLITPHTQLCSDEQTGELRDFEARIVPKDTEEVLAIVRDVTERKRAENQLAKSEERYRVVSELTSDFAYAARIDINGQWLTDWMTGAYSRISGYSWEEIQGRGGWESLIHPDDMAIFSDRVQVLLYWHSDISEYRIFNKQGEIRWLRDYSQPVQCEDEERVLLIYGAAQDITERKLAEEALRQQTERERLIRGMQERIRQSLKLEEILNKVVEEVRAFLQVERVAIYQIEPGVKGKFVVESVTPGCSSVLNRSLNDPCFNTDYAHKYQQGRISAIDDIYQANLIPCYVELLANIQIRALLLVPIVFNNQLWGLLCVHQCSAPRHWEPFEIDSIQQLATQVAIAIQQSQLYQQIQTLNADLERQVQERTHELQKALEFEETLRRINEEVRDSLDENRILQKAVQELALGLGVSGCNASLYDLEAGTSTMCYEKVVSIPAEQGRVAIMTNYLEIYSQLLQGQHFQFCSIKPHPKRGRVAMLACPIFDDKGVLGDLWLIHRPDYGYSDLEVRLVQQVATQCAIAIRQARLYQASQAQVEDLAKLNQLKDDFLSTVSHELRTPMSNIKMAIQMLKLSPTPERSQRYLEILQAECNRETELINDLLDLQRLEAESYPLELTEEVNLPEWIPDIVEPFYSRAQDHQQILQVELAPDLTTLISDYAGLGRIIAELLNNACKYTPGGGGIVLRVTQQQDNNESGKIDLPEVKPNANQVPMTVFTISNQAEIPAEELPHLFEKFYRVPKADLWQQGGTGLGLALVQKLVEQMKGTIQVTSSNGWTQFRIELPTNP
jgi:PAS domain S-box-containing protein